MKKISKIALSLAAAGLFVIGCATTSGGDISATSLSLRKASVFSEKGITPEKATFTKAAPGTAKTIDRSFVNAPPLIPHSVVGLVPITKNNNACLGCHLPEVAKSVHATPIPKSHFMNWRPTYVIGKKGKLSLDGHVVAKTDGNKVYVSSTHGKLYPGRYNCTQCHIPQSNAKPLVKNTFKPDFITTKELKRSNLSQNYDAGVNTIK